MPLYSQWFMNSANTDYSAFVLHLSLFTSLLYWDRGRQKTHSNTMGRLDMPVSLPTLGLVWNRRGDGCSSTRPEPLWRWSLQESCAGTWPGGGNAELETRVTSPCTILRTGWSFPCTDDSSWSASKTITPPACPSVCKVINSLHWCDTWCCRWQCVVLWFFFSDSQQSDWTS